MLVYLWEKMGPGVAATNSQLDWELEARLGYHRLPTQQQLELIAAFKQRRVAAHHWHREALLQRQRQREGAGQAVTS